MESRAFLQHRSWQLPNNGASFSILFLWRTKEICRQFTAYHQSWSGNGQGPISHEKDGLFTEVLNTEKRFRRGWSPREKLLLTRVNATEARQMARRADGWSLARVFCSSIIISWKVKQVIPVLSKISFLWESSGRNFIHEYFMWNHVIRRRKYWSVFLIGPSWADGGERSNLCRRLLRNKLSREGVEFFSVSSASPFGQVFISRHFSKRNNMSICCRAYPFCVAECNIADAVTKSNIVGRKSLCSCINSPSLYLRVYSHELTHEHTHGHSSGAATICV